MVAKISVGSSLFGALPYNQKKIDENKGKVLFSNRMFESKDGSFSLHQCIKSFEMHLPQDIKTEKPIIHISLNSHPEDKLTDEQLSDIAKEYMEKLGYENQPYIVYKHEDIDRHHLHIISLRVDEYGRKLNDKFEHRRSKATTRELEKKYGLHPAEKIQRNKNHQYQKVNYKAGNIKNQLSNTIKGIVYDYQFQSLNELKSLLLLYNIHLEEIKGEVRDKSYHGLVYSATNNKGEKMGNPIKSSRIGRSLGLDALNQRIERNKLKWKEENIKYKSKEHIDDVLTKKSFTTAI